MGNGFGVDLDTKAGEHAGEIVVNFDNSRADRRPVSIVVKSVKFPTTELKVDDQYVQLSPANQQRANREAKELEAIYANLTPEILWTKQFAVPVTGQMKGSNFGHRRVFNGQARAPHSGSDLKASTGTPIHATNRGRVVLAKNLFFSGNTVILDHGLGIFTVYAHLLRIDVKPAQLVDENQLLGLAGKPPCDRTTPALGGPNPGRSRGSVFAAKDGMTGCSIFSGATNPPQNPSNDLSNG